ncbi:uncharacterized protein LOC127794648 [Diospyros lotus]|uniref:uncharacterized protein LOC127794648 n=1 Tax=Diospyros lotus TaxID=55363 RepID=UPI00225AD337|nr:uncharacterized protein LOC127794648 [Diospyros lotus]
MNRDPPFAAADDLDGEDYSASGCSCFRLFCFGSGRDAVEGRGLLQPGGEQKESQRWVATKLREVKEASEMVAGPKWKNFIRRISKYFNKKYRNQFQYDPQSYALNFDDGVGEDDDDGYMFGYSSRFSAPFSGEQRRAAGL